MRSLALVLAACGGGPSFVGTVASAPAARRCTPESTLPMLNPRFAPRVDGLEVISATGDARLSTAGPARGAWSQDGSIVTLADDTGVTMWRPDGLLFDQIACPVVPSALALSDDLRWVVVAGVERPTGAPVTCVADRSGHEGWTIPFTLSHPHFENDLLVSDGHAWQMRPSREVPAPHSPPAPSFADEVRALGIDIGDATLLAHSRDGRRVVGYTGSDIVVWDVMGSHEKWRAKHDCCVTFSPGDRFLVGAHDLFDVNSGDRLALSAIAIAPDDTRAVVADDNGRPALWALDRPARTDDIVRPRIVVARAGEVEAALDGGELVVQRPGDCFALGVHPDAVALSGDGGTLYATQGSTVFAWSTAGAELVAARIVPGVLRGDPVPYLDRFAVATPDGLRLVDASTGDSSGDGAPFTGPAVANRRTLVGERGSDIVTWDGSTVVERPAPGHALAVAASDDLVAAGYADGVVRLWNGERTIAVDDKLPGPVGRLAFRDGLLAAADALGNIVVIDATGAIVGSVHLVMDRAIFLAWRPGPVLRPGTRSPAEDPDELVIDTARGFRITMRRGSA